MGQRRVRRGAVVLGTLWLGAGVACGGNPGREAMPPEPETVLPGEVSPPEAPEEEVSSPPPTAPPPVEPEACDGVMPEAHRAPRIITDVLTAVGRPQPEHSDYYACTAPALTDGEGNLVLPIERTRSYMGYVEGLWTFFDAQGQKTGTFEGIRHEVVPAARGFQGVLGMARWGSPWLGFIDPQGTMAPPLQAEAFTLAFGVGGELRAGSALGWISRGEEAMARVKVVAADAAGAWRFGPVEVGSYPWSVESPDRVATGVDRSGRVLVVWDGTSLYGVGRLAARWLAPDGSFLTPPFDAGVSMPAGTPWFRPDYHGYGTLAPLIDGGLVLHMGGGWARFFPSGEAASSPPPEWLVAWPGRKLEIIRGGRAYALMPDPGFASSGDGSPLSVELFGRDGTACGTWTPPLPGEPRGTLRLGGDGSVLWSALPACEVRWWPALLR